MADYMSGEGSETVGELRPLFTQNRQNKEALHGWLKKALKIAFDMSEDRIRTIRQNIERYSGNHWQDQDSREERRTAGSQTAGTSKQAGPKTPKITVNHLYDLTENKVARLSRFKPIVEARPANSDEYEDKLAAERNKEFLDYLAYINKLNQKFRVLSRVKYVCGSGYVWIDWDKCKGGLDPRYSELAKKGPVPLIGENGEHVYVNNEPVYIEPQDMYLGDIDYEIVTPDCVFLEPMPTYEKSQWLFREYWEDKDILRARYPNAKIGEEAPEEIYERFEYDWDNVKLIERLNRVKIYEFWHKGTEFLPNGFWARFAQSDVFEFGDHPFPSHKDFPCERIVDINVPNKREGQSNFQNTKQLNNVVNMVKTMKVGNAILGGQLHWIARENDCQRERLGNDRTIIWYRNTPPQAYIPQISNQSLDNVEKESKEDMQQISGVFGVSRGEPPPGIKAGVALNFLEEQENERMNAEVQDFGECIEAVFNKTLSVVKDRYKEDDPRMMRTFGKHGEWEAKEVNIKDLHMPTHIRINNSSELPQSRAGQAQFLLEVDERKPGLISNHEFLERLGLGTGGKVGEEMMRSYKAAQYDFNAFLNKKDVPDPQEYYDLTTYWQVFFHGIQATSFKYGTPEKIKKNVLDYINALEMMIDKKMRESPALAEQVATTMPYFPVVFVRQPPLDPALAKAPVELPPEMGLPPGTPIPSQIPGQELAQPLDMTQGQNEPLPPIENPTIQ